MVPEANKAFAELTQRKRRGQRQLTRPVFMPSPMGGINSVTNMMTAPPEDALSLVNMIPNDYGVQVRNGYVEHCQPVPLGDGIKTLIPFENSASDTPVRKLFACTSDGIYDVTTAGGTPVKVYDFANKDARAGWCSWAHYINTAQAQFLLVCDNSNGYILYTASTDTWAAGTVTGPATESTFDFVTIWKNRIWFVEGNSGRAWYLPVGELTGTAKEFNFGNKFRYGGYLKSLWNWTVDGGEGMDDYLVALSSAGDMVVYKGTDPDTTGGFIMHGSWYIGRPTQGRRNGDDAGGELLLLTQFGLLQCSKLIAGLPATDEQVALSYKINPRINRVLQRGNNVYGWQIKFDPASQLIFVLSPQEQGADWMQFVYSMTTRAWAQFVGIPMNCAEVLFNKLYFGDKDNRVYTYSGNLDNVMLDDAGASAVPVEWTWLSTYQTLGEPAIYKRVQFLRPQFIGLATPSYVISARYNFDLSEVDTTPPYVVPSGSLWDSALWDTAKWNGGYVVDTPPRGAYGMGRSVAIAMRGESAAETVFIGVDVLFDSGGML
jgi:hypothetical protein